MQQAVTPFLLSSLPPLPEAGAAVPVVGAELRRLVRGTSAQAVVDAVLLSADLLIHRTLLARPDAMEGEEPPLSVLTVEQATGDEPLPGPLAGDGETVDAAEADDALWERYFLHVLEVADTCGSAFLADWGRFEMGLRNGLNRLRAEELDVDTTEALYPDDLVVLAEADRSQIDDAVAAFRDAPDPLAAQRAVDELRMAWLDRHAATFSFDVDELGFYAARLVLAERWRRIALADAGDEDGRSDGPTGP